jgi:hypothetical protein
VLYRYGGSKPQFSPCPAAEKPNIELVLSPPVTVIEKAAPTWHMAFSYPRRS